MLPRVYPIADSSFGDPVRLAAALFDGGARLVQLRNKQAGAGELLRQVEAILKSAPAASQLIVNDRADVAAIAHAAGVHLGQADLSPDEARKILLPGQLVGHSTHNLRQAMASNETSADYIAVGPIFPTTSKSNPDPVVGLDGLREICSHVSKPVVAIGGITLATFKDVLACGAASVAVIGDILKFEDVAERMGEWLR